MNISYKVQFRDRSSCTAEKRGDHEDEEEPEGPIVERQCPQCKNNKMSYATLQMRSADEGQTVFYTCTKCKSVFLLLIKNNFLDFNPKSTRDY